MYSSNFSATDKMWLKVNILAEYSWLNVFVFLCLHKLHTQAKELNLFSISNAWYVNVNE